ncbi:glycosyltransferase family 2 protein [Martelella radicis]|uniref:Glycosyltransferase involved in cell wall biosynthesis n=1 Tax=Martelella radicis TaxID=1397476 RepID=A0A7W6KI56_9HYPH|nr:glycosyltransferase family 2 protein [Martelella radicis]MBB4120634.1 glycosyltransferase involved in cell wall biosynthesis [Martelella radicis]
MTNQSPAASIVVPAYNAATTIRETLNALVDQTFADFEIIVVDDGSSDSTVAIVESYSDPRIRLISQANRGLAGAHNTGIAAAKGAYIGFCDADDLWLPEKLELHIRHLRENPDVGISFAGSSLIDRDGKSVGINQSPKLTNITAADVLCRNPIGNGSAAVVRAEALANFGYRPAGETERDWWFDENFRQSDDIEGWLRFIVTQDWKIEGIPGHLTLYRIHIGGLSANVEKQFSTWLAMRDKIARIAPDLIERHGDRAAAYQLRYLARRCVSMRQGRAALGYALRSLKASRRPFIEEPVKSVVTLAAAVFIALAGDGIYGQIENRLLGASNA